MDILSEGGIVTRETEERWAIDLNWLKANNHSFTTMTKSCLCAKCRKKLKIDLGEATTGDILKALNNCCSRVDGFILPTLPLQESIFRIFLANRNQPLTIEELCRQMDERRGNNTYRTSAPVLVRLLKSDRHYGLRLFTK
jgi:hypothetical protein